MARNAKAAARREAQFYARQDVQQCAVCGRWFCRRKDNVCSIACAQKVAAAKATLCLQDR